MLKAPSGSPMATSAAVAPPSLLTQVGMAGGAAVITVTFIHPIDVVKVRCSVVDEHYLRRSFIGLFLPFEIHQ